MTVLLADQVTGVTLTLQKQGTEGLVHADAGHSDTVSA
jgi:hypothetical protein